VKISTTVRLNQDDILEAARQYVIDALDLAENADVTASQTDDGDIIVEVSSDDDGSEPKTAPAKDASKKPKATRAPRKPAAAATPPADDDHVAEGAAKFTELHKAEEPPFDVDDTAKANDAKTAQEVFDAPKPSLDGLSNEALADKVAAVKAAAPAIFANAKSSAAPETPKPSPVMSAKSLFANLTPPANQ
jgi:hypothetical protein